MRALIQRVREARVRVDGDVVGEIGLGFLVLLGVGRDDDERSADRLAAKVRKLRLFDDDDGRMNLALGDVGAATLVVSQFTLYGDARGGNRPSYSAAARPEQAEPLYLHFCAALERGGVAVATGVFGAGMAVELVNLGPVTLWLDSDAL